MNRHVFYLTQSGRCMALSGSSAARVLACPAAKKAPTVQNHEGLRLNITMQRCVKKGAKNRLSPALESMAGDEHSGGQDWHPSAGMRYRLWRSEWA
jgi:hypothetical protein